MKYLYLSIIALGFMVAGVANAEIKTCGDGHAIWSADSTKIVNCISKDAWEAQKIEAEQRRINDLGGKLKAIMQGQKFWDMRGFENGCEWWYPMHCVIKPEWFGTWL